MLEIFSYKITSCSFYFKKDSSRFESFVNKPSNIIEEKVFMLKMEKAKDLYKACVYTTMYRIGRKGGVNNVLTNEKLYNYGRKVFQIEEEVHQMIINDVQEMDLPEIQLNLRVFEAQDLEAKDANGLSDPFCTMYLLRQADINPEKRRLSMRTPSLDQDDEFKATKVIPKTLNPKWDQSFKFDVLDVAEQVLHIDVWDRDDELELDSSNRITSIKGFRGAGRYVKGIYHSARAHDDDTKDDFLGLIDVPLKTVTDKEFDIWLQLQPRSIRKVVSGKLHLKFSLSFKDSQECVINNESPHTIYKCILSCFVHDEWVRMKELHDNPDFSFSLCPEALILLSNYVVQHCIPAIDVNAMKWEVYSKIYTESEFFPIDVLIELLENHQNMVKSKKDKMMEYEDFIHSLGKFVDYVFKLFAEYRHHFKIDDDDKCSYLGKVLRCVQMVYDFPSFKNHHPDKCLKNNLQDVLQESTRNWIYRIKSFSSTDVEDLCHGNDPENIECPCRKLSTLVKVIHAVTEYIKEENRRYAHHFVRLEMHYFTMVFNTVELMLSEMVEKETKHLEEELLVENEINQDGVGTKLFELYLCVRSLLDLKQDVPESHQNTEGVCNYSKWFKKCAIKWNHIATEKAKKQIANAIELDKVQVINEMVKHSSSAVDVTCCLSQICTFWKRLDWPDPSDAFMLVAHITDIVGECGRYYVDIIFRKLKDKGFYDDIGQFEVTRELCIMMNNAAHVIEFFNHAPRALQFDKILYSLKELHGEERTAVFHGTLQRIIKCAKDAMYCKIEKILDSIGVRMRESMQPIIEKILQNKKRETPEVMSDPLVKYVESNLITLNSALLSTVFFRILRHFWNDFLQCSADLMRIKGERMSINNYCVLYDLVETMKLYFYCDGGGLTEHELEYSVYHDLITYLELYKLPTDNLIEKFFVERYAKQHSVTWDLGSLTFKIFYAGTGKLKVLIMNCRNLKPMDSDGRADPYVVVELKPAHLFNKCSSFKTKYIEDTLTPLFDEEFEFNVSSEVCSYEGATLIFTLYDHDLIKHKKMGNVFYNLNQLSCEPSGMEDQFSIHPQVELPLSNLQLDGEIYRALRSRRKQDKMAANFVEHLKWL